MAVNAFDALYDVLVARSKEFSGRPSTIRIDAAFGQDIFMTVIITIAIIEKYTYVIIIKIILHTGNIIIYMYINNT